ncbi:MAG: glutamate racemase [Oscillospiraceae bacterium]|nr:glutamate racemase [Oscillospiraceae bacterium]
MNNKPIGVFDSGVGGLTAVRELKKLLPDENIVYFGDTGRNPYGTRSKNTIIKYAKQAVRFLMKHDVKAVIAACGTVSTVLDEKAALDILGKDMPYTGIVLPATRTACAMSAGGRIGVIATTAAIRSGAYGRAVRAISPSAKVFGNACPLLVPLVENGMIGVDNKISRLVLEMYLRPLMKEEIDTLILGCTHFPLLYDLINDVLGYDVTLIDPCVSAVAELKTGLTKQGMLNESADGGGRVNYFLTDSPENFESVVALFLRGEANGKITHIDIESIDA